MRDYKLDGCFMDDDKRFTLIHIYKNASISMRNALNMRGKFHEWSDTKNYPDTVTLCVLRNPMDRVISSYQYLLRLEDNGFINKHPIHITKETNFFKTQNYPIDSFKGFIEYIEKNGFYDAVTLPQIEFLRDRGITVDDIDEIFIQERLKEDFNKFSLKYNLGIELPHDNVSDNKVSLILKEYVKEHPNTQKRIKKIYSEDFDLYNKVIDNE